MISVVSVYNAYLNRGGEDEVFDKEAALLEQHGHRVLRYRVEADSLRSPGLAARAGLVVSTIWSRRFAEIFEDLLDQERPDVVHFHNTFPLISPSAIATCARSRAAVVQTLHNFRLLCPSATFYRDNHPCEDCLGKTPPYPSVVHGCYRNSRAQTAVVTSMLTAHRLRKTWSRNVDRYIAMTAFARSKFIEGGLPGDRVTVKPNFVAAGPAPVPSDRQPYLFVGRLAPHKGIGTLVNAARMLPDHPSIRIAGDGPLLSAIDQATDTIPSLIALGRLDGDRVTGEMRKARAVIFPSEWYEGCPLVIIESFASGTPVIASRLGAMAHMVDDGVTGLLFEPGNADDLATKVRWANEHPVEMRRMGENARRAYEAKYTPERNYEMLMDIYSEAIDRDRGRGA